MVDFRSRDERQNERNQKSAEQTDYKRMYEQVLAENRAIHSKLDEITTNHGELQARFADLLSQFEAQSANTNERADALLKISKNMEGMVSTAYEKQGALMDRFRADLNQRLGEAKGSLNELEE